METALPIFCGMMDRKMPFFAGIMDTAIPPLRFAQGAV